jgi:hypothetical protein
MIASSIGWSSAARPLISANLRYNLQPFDILDGFSHAQVPSGPRAVGWLCMVG